MIREAKILNDFLIEKKETNNKISKKEFVKFIIQQEQVSMQTVRNYFYVLKLLDIIKIEKEVLILDLKNLKNALKEKESEGLF